jgi:hypothetical protein
MTLAVLLLVVGAHGSALANLVPAAVALAGIGVTGGLLVSDLKRPERFYYLFTKPVALAADDRRAVHQPGGAGRPRVPPQRGGR